MGKPMSKMAGEGPENEILFLWITLLINNIGRASKLFWAHWPPRKRILASNLGPLILHSFPFFSTSSFLTITNADEWLERVLLLDKPLLQWGWCPNEAINRRTPSMFFLPHVFVYLCTLWFIMWLGVVVSVVGCWLCCGCGVVMLLVWCKLHIVPIFLLFSPNFVPIGQRNAALSWIHINSEEWYVSVSWSTNTWTKSAEVSQ